MTSTVEISTERNSTKKNKKPKKKRSLLYCPLCSTQPLDEFPPVTGGDMYKYQQLIDWNGGYLMRLL